MRERIYLQDEAPRLGCGWRVVDVKIGTKWAYFTDTANGKRVRMKKADASRIIQGSSRWQPKTGKQRGSPRQ